MRRVERIANPAGPSPARPVFHCGRSGTRSATEEGMDCHWRLARHAIAIVVLLGLLMLTGAEAVQGAGTVVASGLANPRGIAVAPDGTLYVAEAGLSGSEAFSPPAPYPGSTRGTSGRVTRVGPDGTQTAVATGLPSLALGGDGSFFVFGPHGLVLSGGTLWLATGAMVNGFPPAQNAADVLRIDPQSG